MVYRFIILFLPVFSWFDCYSQQSYVITRDSVKLISLYYWDDENRKTTAEEYSYVEHNGSLYNATKYLNPGSKNSGCITLSLVNINNDCSFNIIKKYKKKNPKLFKMTRELEPFAFKCTKLEVIFITEYCELQKSEYNPLLNLMGNNKFVVIHFLNVISDKLLMCDLPNQIITFLATQSPSR